MPFGLKNAPALFQHLMNKVLMGREFVAVYLDDIIVFSDTSADHLAQLKQVLQRFAVAGLKLKPSKWHFICQTVEYLGHTITPKQISPNNSRVIVIQSHHLNKRSGNLLVSPPITAVSLMNLLK